MSVTPIPALLDVSLRRHGIDPSVVQVLPGTLRSVVCRGTEVTSLDALRAAATGRRPWRPPAVVTSPLNDREAAVAELVAAGKRTPEIATVLGVSERTITSARQALRTKAVVVADDHPEEIRVVGAPTLLRDLVHDCLVGSGFPVARLAGSGPTTDVVVLVEPTARDLLGTGDCRTVVVGEVPRSVGLVNAIARGLIAVLDAGVAPAELCDAVDAARHGRPTLSAGVITRLVDELWRPSDRPTLLTERERAVLDGVARLESVKQTAKRLGLSAKTVENHRQQAYRKLGVRSAHEARARYSVVAPPQGPSDPPASSSSSVRSDR